MIINSYLKDRKQIRKRMICNLQCQGGKKVTGKMKLHNKLKTWKFEAIQMADSNTNNWIKILPSRQCCKSVYWNEWSSKPRNHRKLNLVYNTQNPKKRTLTFYDTNTEVWYKTRFLTLRYLQIIINQYLHFSGLYNRHFYFGRQDGEQTNW